MLLCGKIVNTHGVAGDVKMLYYTDGPAFFDNVKTLFLPDNKPLTLISARVHKGSIIMKFKEIDTMEKAEQLKGKEIFVKREEAEPLPEGRYYIADILGINVFKDDGEELGKVTDVFKTGSNDVYTVKNSSGKEYLIPVIESVIMDIDIENKKIIIKPMKGLLDDED